MNKEFKARTIEVFESNISSTLNSIDLDSPFAGLLLQTAITDTAKFLKNSLPNLSKIELTNIIDEVMEEMLYKYLDYDR